MHAGHQGQLRARATSPRHHGEPSWHFHPSRRTGLHIKDHSVFYSALDLTWTDLHMHTLHTLKYL